MHDSIAKVFATDEWPVLPFGQSIDVLIDDLPWDVASRYDSKSGSTMLVKLSSHGKGEIKTRGSTSSHPEYAEFVRHNKQWKLAKYTMMSDRLRNSSGFDCKDISMNLHLWVEAISSELVRPGAKVTTSANYNSLNCKQLRFGDEPAGWTLSRYGVTVSVTFRAFPNQRKDVLMIEYTVDKF